MVWWRASVCLVATLTHVGEIVFLITALASPTLCAEVRLGPAPELFMACVMGTASWGRAEAVWAHHLTRPRGSRGMMARHRAIRTDYNHHTTNGLRNHSCRIRCTRPHKTGGYIRQCMLDGCVRHPAPCRHHKTHTASHTLPTGKLPSYNVWRYLLFMAGCGGFGRCQQARPACHTARTHR